MSAEQIDGIRKSIISVDEKIFGLVAERLRLAESIGRLKRAQKEPLRNYSVEARVIEHAESYCTSIGIDRAIAREIAKTLIGASLSVQASSDIQVYSGERKRILIVGGNGTMGRWYGNFFNVQGHEVLVHDVGGNSPFPSAADLEKGALNSDVVLFSTPISITPSLLSRVIDTGTEALVMDGCSLKSPLLAEIRRGISSGMHIASIHPMFGPSARMLADQNLVVCDCGSREAADMATSLFSDTCLTITRLDLEEHDEMMVYVLGITHAVNIMLFNSLEASGMSYSDMEKFASTTFRKQMKTTADVAMENPSLYYEIQNLNMHRDKVFSSLQSSLETVKDASFSADGSAFFDLVRRGRDYFGGCRIE